MTRFHWASGPLVLEPLGLRAPWASSPLGVGPLGLLLGPLGFRLLGLRGLLGFWAHWALAPLGLLGFGPIGLLAPWALGPLGEIYRVNLELLGYPRIPGYPLMASL